MRNVHDKMADGKAAYEITCGVTFGGPEIPLGPNVSCKPILSKDEARPRQSWQNDASQNLHVIMYCVRGEDGQAICSSRITSTSGTCQPPISTSNGPSTRKSSFPCTDGSLKLPGGTLEQDDKDEEDTFCEEEDAEYFWSMSGDFIIATTKYIKQNFKIFLSPR